MSVSRPIYKDNWNRLRVAGFSVSPVDSKKMLTNSEVIFVPINQVMPPSDDPYAADSNTLHHLCDLQVPWFRCEMFRVNPDVLGHHMKYLLRQTNHSNPEMFSEVQKPDDLYSPNLKEYYPRPKTHPEMTRPWKNPAEEIVYDLQAYANKIIISDFGTENIRSPYWPDDYIDMSTCRELVIRSRKVTIAKCKTLELPTNISNGVFGNLLLRIWAGISKLSYPPPPEYATFVERIMS